MFIDTDSKAAFLVSSVPFSIEALIHLSIAETTRALLANKFSLLDSSVESKLFFC